LFFHFTQLQYWGFLMFDVSVYVNFHVSSSVKSLVGTGGQENHHSIHFFFCKE
jgi:hypothetical protein